MTITPELRPWPEVAGEADWGVLLLGNGASQAVWREFSYPSLFQVARTRNRNNPLQPEDEALFRALGNTRNFEGVLAGLDVSRRVMGALGIEMQKVEERYESIRAALVEAVHLVHVPWRLIDEEVLRAVRAALLEYEYVFSTNYDLVVYWSMMVGEGSRFRDFFWGGPFDSSDTEVWGKATKVLYLHGGLHLYRSWNGSTFKDRAAPFENLLDRFGTLQNSTPLFISEGTADEKQNAIRRSDYLSFALQRFSTRKAPLVVFGHGLGDSDSHLVDAVNRHRGRRIAYSVLPGSDADIIQRKAAVTGRFPEAEITFFDATTHPLGSDELRVSPPQE